MYCTSCVAMLYYLSCSTDSVSVFNDMFFTIINLLKYFMSLPPFSDPQTFSGDKCAVTSGQVQDSLKGGAKAAGIGVDEEEDAKEQL